MKSFIKGDFVSRYHADKWLFFAVFLVGCIAIVVLDLAQIAKVSAVAICVALLLAYAATTFLIPALRLRPDQAADNSYYLGLLFTLTSLGVALFRFSTTDEAAESILRNFGVAIFTTIVGLGLRVFLSQFREDPDDLEYEAKTALAETVRRLRGDLDQSIAEMQGFAVGARQALQEVSEAASTSTLDTLSTAVSRFEASADDMGRRFEATAATFEARGGAFDRSLENVAGAVETLTARIGSIRADEGLFEDGLKPVFVELQTRVGEFADTFSKEQKKLSKSLAALTSVAETLQGFDLASEAISRSAAQLGAASEALGQGAESFERLDTATRSAAAAATAYGEAIDGVARQQTERDIASADALAKSIDLLNARAQRSLSVLDDSSRQVAASLSSLNAEFSGSGEAVQRVRRELAELAGWIIERLDRR
jgi:hypothetical protein